MRGVVVAASLGLVLSAALVLVQAATQPTPAKPAGQTPAPQPSQTPAPPPPALPPAPFPQGAKVAYVNIQTIAQLSTAGKSAASKVDAFATKKQAEIADKTKALQGAQEKLQKGGAVMSEQARAQLEKDIERQTRDLQRVQQDAQAQLAEIQRELQAEFQKKLLPVLEQLAKEKKLEMLFSATDAGLIWAEPALNLTEEAVKRMDSAPGK